MSWITDWTASLWSQLFDVALGQPLKAAIENLTPLFADVLPPDAADKVEKIGQKAGIGASPVHPVITAAVTPIWILAAAKLAAEPMIQSIRMAVMDSVYHYPIEAEKLSEFMLWSDVHHDLAMTMHRYTGQIGAAPGAFFELARTKVDLPAIRELFLRGQLTPDEADVYLKEQGYPNRVVNFEPIPDLPDYRATYVPRPDRDRVRSLFSIVPDIQSIITMEMRDAFPNELSIYVEERESAQWAEWYASKHAHDPTVVGWEPGTGEVLLEKLKEGEKYGFQSYESFAIKGRDRYSKAFEAIALSKGLDPYWSMKLWESHWKLPGYASLREMLYRAPIMTEQFMGDILRWQDFPPGLTQAMVDVAYHPLTRVDVRRMHLRGVLSVGRVYQAYLAHGFNGRDASRMTAFTVVYNASSTYGGVVKEILDSYSDGAVDMPTAAEQIWGLVAVEVPDGVPDWMGEEFTEEQIAAVADVYPEIDSQLRGWIDKQLELAAVTRGLDIAKERLSTAKKQFTAWAWSEQRTREYLYRHGYSAARVSGLLERWVPVREQKERLPSRTMLEDFLVEQGMPVDTWKRYMSRLGYSDTIIMQILEGVGQLPTRAMLESFWTLDVINDATFRDYMRRLGFDNATIDRTLEVLEKRRE